jgi:hypothetical protein
MLSSFRQDQGVIEAILLLSRLLLKATSIAEHLRHMFQLDLYLDPLSHSPETDISLLTYVAQLLKRLVDISATVTEVGVKLYSSTEEELLSLLAYTKDLNLSENTLDEIKKLADSGVSRCVSPCANTIEQILFSCRTSHPAMSFTHSTASVTVFKACCVLRQKALAPLLIHLFFAICWRCFYPPLRCYLAILRPS